MSLGVIAQSLRLHDFEEFDATLREWDIETTALDGHRFAARLFQAATPHVLLNNAWFSGRVAQHGAPPVGYRTVCLTGSPDQTFFLCGQQIRGHQLLVFPDGAEADMYVPRELDVITISIAQQRLDALADELESPGLDALRRGREVIACDPSGLARLRRKARDAEGLHSGSQADGAVRSAQIIASDLPIAVFRALAGSEHPRGTQARADVFVMAMTHVRDAPREPWSVAELAAACGVTPRTLETAFNERCGMPPKRTLKRLRLHGARRDIQMGAMRIVDAARAWGFWHLGEFAADYRGLFGELPSRTPGHGAPAAGA